MTGVSHTGKIIWTTEHQLPIAEQSMSSTIALAECDCERLGLKMDSRGRLVLKRFGWPLLKIRNDLLVDGFIKREVGGLLAQYLHEDTVLLDVGCGDMSLSRFLPVDMWYNGLDIQISQFHIARVLKRKPHTNLVLASAARIPVESNTVTLLVSTETLEHIRHVDEALREMHRVATPGSILVCSIPNNHCLKYQKKGPHPDHVNNWTFQGFADFMARHGFDMVEGYMKGYWIPLPARLFKTSYQLPLSCRDERLNTNFFYVFKTIK
ncbi:MAG: class I SAM-dependent methyltransferase [Sedimentisphaerales bacterium]|nr:class I SAM-dependent methyltransferase [Sedimentisphaerales bacterium]